MRNNVSELCVSAVKMRRRDQSRDRSDPALRESERERVLVLARPELAPSRSVPQGGTELRSRL